MPACLPVVDHSGVHTQRPLAQPAREVAQFAHDVLQRPCPPQSLGPKPFVGLPPGGRWSSHGRSSSSVRLARLVALYDLIATANRLQGRLMSE